MSVLQENPLPALLRTDCTRCAALCCMALAFDKSEFFAHDKSAGDVCRHLAANNRCGIHDKLERRGYVGCVHFDCLGAGQRVTREVFDGSSWRDDPSLTRSMIDALRAMRLLHELLSLLQTAAQLSLTDQEARRCEALLKALQPSEKWTPENLEAFEHGETPATTRQFLKTLRKHVADERQDQKAADHPAP